MLSSLAELESIATSRGLVLRGGFLVQDSDAVPDISEGVPSRSLVLLGNAGSSLWAQFVKSTEYRDGEADPLDRWSERIGNELARKLNARAFFPFGGPPYQPFLSWAKKAESLESSRLGMLIHPQYGLWHAYRFAIALDCEVEGLESVPAVTDICNNCRDQPCLTVCPVQAFTGTEYLVESCYDYLKSDPHSSCRKTTCQARLACPEGKSFHYNPSHANFHMEKFYRNLVQRFDP